MQSSVKIRFTSIFMMVMLLLAACGGDSTPDPSISTAVAQTVEAQNAATANAVSPSETPAVTNTPLQFIPTLTPLSSVASPTLPSNNNTAKSECAKASFVSQTIPDETIFTPGEAFTQTWEIKNESSCTWTTSYKIVFWKGDILGGGYYYNLPQTVPPGTTFPISLLLVAPDEDGSYVSQWMLQTPEGTNFGVGEYSVPFYTEIAVSSAKHPNYAVTSVEYDITRDPPTGCPANVLYTVYATITTNGPLDFTYRWLQSDNNNSKPLIYKIKQAGSVTFSREWRLHLGSTPGSQRWIAIELLDPVENAYLPGPTILYDCGAY